MIPSQWYTILKLKKTEVIAQLTARKITHTITSHIATLKSKLYQYIKKNVKPLLDQFKALIGNDWEIAFNQSGKSFKQFRKDLLLRFHPDKHNGCVESTEITQTINGWTEPVEINLDEWGVEELGYAEYFNERKLHETIKETVENLAETISRFARENPGFGGPWPI